MKTATYASARTANAAQRSLNSGLKVAFRSGAVMGLTVVGLGLLDIAIWWIILNAFVDIEGDVVKVKLIGVCSGCKNASMTLKNFVEAELKENYEKAKAEFDHQSILNLLSDEVDKNDCFLSVHSGAGGTEACDWTFMLSRMYQRWAERHGYKVEILEQEEAEGGLKSINMKISGPYVYGYTKGEAGVHRLVRISPFDANARRHTSFASVDVMPQFNASITIDLDEKDLEIETMRASGAGGQHINKTDSAVRITHVPSGISVKCQNGRSQHDNKDLALQLLKSKLYQREIEEREKKMASINDN